MTRKTEKTGSKRVILSLLRRITFSHDSRLPPNPWHKLGIDRLATCDLLPLCDMARKTPSNVCCLFQSSFRAMRVIFLPFGSIRQFYRGENKQIRGTWRKHKPKLSIWAMSTDALSLRLVLLQAERRFPSVFLQHHLWISRSGCASLTLEPHQGTWGGQRPRWTVYDH